MRRLLLLIVLIGLIGIVSAVPSVQLNTTTNYTTSSTYPIISMFSNVSMQNVNSSDFWDNLDTPADIFTADLTDDNTYCRLDENLELGSYNITADWGFFNSINVSSESIYLGGIKISETGGELNVSTNVTSPFFIGDGSKLTNLNLSSEGNLIVDGNVTADYFFGDGSQLTGISAGDVYNNTDGKYNISIDTNFNITADNFIGNSGNLSIINLVEDASTILSVNDGGVQKELLKVGGIDKDGDYRSQVIISDVPNVEAFDASQTKLLVAGNDTSVIQLLVASNTATRVGTFRGYRSRGTLDTPVIVEDGDRIFDLHGYAWDGDSVFTPSATIRMEVDGATSAGVVPMKIEFQTSETGGAGKRDRLIVKADGSIEIPNDNKKLLLGAGQDMAIYYNGSDGHINCQEVGSGNCYITGDLISNSTGASLGDTVQNNTDAGYRLIAEDINSTTGTFNDMSITQGLTINAGKSSLPFKLTMEGGQSVASPNRKGGSVEWKHGDSSSTTAVMGYTFVNTNGHFVFDTTSQSVSTDDGNAYIGFDGSATLKNLTLTDASGSKIVFDGAILDKTLSYNTGTGDFDWDNSDFTGIDNLAMDGNLTGVEELEAEHLKSTDDIEMGDKLIHTQNSGTYIDFSTGTEDKVDIYINNTAFITAFDSVAFQDVVRFGSFTSDIDVEVLGNFIFATQFDWGDGLYKYFVDTELQDGIKAFYGTGSESSIYYGADNQMYINPQEVGTGDLNVIGNLNVEVNSTAKEFHFPSGRMVNLSHNDQIDGSVFGLMLTNPPNTEVPHFWVQSGGSSQASGIARSFMIVNEDVSILNSTNRTSCSAWADHFGKDLDIDCNTTTTGADLLVGDDLQVFGTVYTEEHEPDTYQVVVGSLDNGEISNLSNMMGEDMVFNEVSGTPGFDIRFNITGLEPEHPKYVVTRWGYDGGSGHGGVWEIYDYDSTTWKSIRKFSDDEGYYSSMTMILSNDLVGTYVVNGVMQIRAYHFDSGINSHDINIDYVGVKY